jgi:hypothetical protein
LVPLLAKLALAEMNWGVEDFAAAGILLFSAGMAYSLAAARTKTRAQRVFVLSGILLALAVVWAELAVGLFQ